MRPIDADDIPYTMLYKENWMQGTGEETEAAWKSDIDRMPTIYAVPMVMCKECKHWDKTWTNDWSPDYHYCPMIDGVRKGDFYCADAERSEDGAHKE